MRRVLIVDDEPIIVQGLLNALRKSKLDIELYDAGSGEEALHLLSQTRMDIVISDVRMPGMDGFELMKRIHEDWPDCRVIFLSGHSDFDMVYRAVQGEAVSFLLKTESFEKIIETLRDAISDLENALHQRETQAKLSAQQEVTRQLLQREALSALVRGRSRKIYAAALEIDLDQPLLPLYAYIESETQALTLEALHDHLLLIDRALRGQLAAYPIRIAFWNHHDDILWLLQPAEGLDMRRCMLYVRETIELIQEAVEREAGMTLAFALHTSPVSADQLAIAYQALRRRICQSMDVPGMIALQPFSSRAAATAPLLTESLTSRLKEAMEHMNRKEFLSLLKKATDVLRQSDSMDDPYALEAFMTISRLFLSYINRWKLHDSVQYPGGLNGLTSISGFTAWSQTADAFMELGQSLFRISEDSQGSRSQDIVAKIREHIENNLNNPDELSLQRIAEITFFNPTYLSRLFHQLMGETLSDYVSGMRMRRANQLLRDSSNRISDVSEAVGFSSAANFSRFYRKMSGRSPQEYRDSLARTSLNVSSANDAQQGEKR